MKPMHQKTLSRILLVSFFLQSCGIEVPISGHQPEGVLPDGVQQLETTSDGSAAPPLPAAELQEPYGFTRSHDGPAQPLPGVSSAAIQDGAVEEPQSGALELTEVDRLFNAIRDGGTDAINSLLSKDRGLLEVLSERDDEVGCKQEYTLLMYAAHLGSEPMVSLLLSSWKPAVNRANKDGLTALHMAAAKGHLAVAKCLKGESAQLDCTNNDGRTPMHLAALNGHLEVVEYLDKNGATSDVRDGSGLTAFYLASSAGHSSVKDYLLQRVIDKHYTDLLEAIDAGKVEKVNEIIAALRQLIDKVDKRTETVKRYIDKLTKERSSAWCDTSRGRSVISKLELLTREGAYALMLKDAAQGFTIGKSPDNRAKLIDILLQLGALHQEQGKALGDLSYYTDAATCYQHVLSICGEEDVATSYALQTNSAYEGLLTIRKALTSTSPVVEIVKIQEEMAGDKQELERLRAYAQVEANGLEELLNQRSTPQEERANEAAYIQRSKALFHDIATKIKAFLARLYLESEQELGPAPCKYTVMGLGSMALQQMTPYSDLEFAILMEECTNEVAARAYFKRLTHLVNFRVINLGETKIPNSKHGVNLEHLIKRGINLDLGGKTPLGRQDKPYTLIQTVAGMLYYLRNESNRVEHIDKNLPYILESTCYVYGDEQLHKTYETQKIEFLADPVIYKARAMQRMLEGTVEWDYTHPDTVGPKSKKQLGNIEEFRLQFRGRTGEEEGKLYDVKKEIYRLPDRLLYGLAFYYGIVPGSGWDAVEQLLDRGVICQEALQHLGYIMSFSNMLRLKTYLHYGQQQESLTMLGGLDQEEAQGEIKRALCLPPEALQTDGSLFKYYYTAIPLHRKMESFFDKLDVRREWMRKYAEGSPDLQQVIEELFRERVLSTTEESNFFSEDSFHDDSAQIKGDIHLRLVQRREAIVHHTEALGIKKEVYGPKHPSVADTLNNLGAVHSDLGDHAQSLTYYREALAIMKEVYGPKHPSVAATLNNLGIVHRVLGDHAQSLTYYREALAIMKEVYGPKHPSVAATLNNLGAVHSDLGEHAQSLSYHREALAIMQEVYGSKHPDVASMLHNLGNVHSDLGEHAQSLSYYREALAIMKEVYSPKHPRVADTLNNLGNVHSHLGDHAQSLSYFREALAIMQEVYGPKHLHIAIVLSGIGNLYRATGEYVKSIQYYEECLDVEKRLYGDVHANVAITLSDLGNVHSVLGEHEKSIGYYEEALQIRRQVYDEPHPSVARTLYSLGNLYKATGEHVKSIQYYEECLGIEKRLHGDTHADIAITLADLGNVHNVLGEHEKSIEYYEEALEIRRQAYDGPHPSVARTLHDLGNVHKDLGKQEKSVGYYEEALQIYQFLGGFLLQHSSEHTQAAESAAKYLEQALEIGKKIHGDIHPTVASILYSLGNVYKATGEYVKSIQYYEECLGIEKSLYGDTHANVATTLADLGNVHSILGEHEKSIGYYEEALQIRRQVYADLDLPHPSIARTLHDLGNVHKDLGEQGKSVSYYEEALQMYQLLGSFLLQHSSEHTQAAESAAKYLEQALEIGKKIHGDVHSTVANIAYTLGNLYKAIGEYAKSIQYYEECLGIEKRLYGDTHADVATTLADLGNVHSILGGYEKSIVYYEEALQIRRQVYGGRPHPSIARTLHDLGNVHRDLGKQEKSGNYYEEVLQMYQLLGGILQHFNKHAQAVEFFEQALEIAKKIHGDVHPDVASILYRLAIAYYSSEQLQKSISHYEEALSVYQQLSEDNPETPYASTRASIAHNLACMYRVEAQAAMQKERNQTSQEYLTKAKATFELAIAANNPPTASLCTEYANFLLATEQYKTAYQYLRQAITISDDKSGLSYSMLERATITLALRERISQDNPISLRPVDYAYYLLIHHYEDFQAAGIHPDKTREAYLTDFQEAVEQRAGQEGKEQEDEIARYLLESLEQEYQPAVAA